MPAAHIATRGCPQAARAAALAPEASRPWLAGALAAHADEALPDLCLLASNAFARDPLAQAGYLNRHLGHFGLPPIALRENHRPLAPINLCAATVGDAVNGGPLVSVLMAVHNAARRVDAAMRSVLDQTWRHLELIVIDDASDDGSWARILAVAAGDARVRPLRLPRQLGPFGAKMIGLQHAQGSLITCHDADDWSHPEKIARQAVPLRARQDLIATTSCWVRVDDEGRFHARQRWPLMRWNPSSTLFRRDPVLARAGAWDVVRTGADSEFLDRLKAVFGADAVHRVGQPLAFGSHRPDSLTTDAVTGFDAHGHSAPREAYASAWHQWHTRVRRRGATPWVPPGLGVAAAHRAFDAPMALRIPFGDIEACQDSAGRPGFMEDTAHRPAWLAASAGLGRTATLAALLQGEVLTDGRHARRHPRLAGVLAWGRKPSARQAERLAHLLGLPVRWLEDGFLRSFLPGPQHPPLSILVDDEGVHYDAARPSALESLLNSAQHLLTGDLAEQTARARALIDAHGLSKYNHAPSLRRRHAVAGGPVLRPGDRQRILLVDQTAGDLSITHGGAHPPHFAGMLRAALEEHPRATVYIKTHPEVSLGHKQGHFTQLRDSERVVVLREAIEPRSLIAEMDQVFVVTSTLGFEALLAGKPVTCFGQPWYAGWGLTDDRQVIARRTRRRGVDELFAAAYLRGARYLDPETHERGTVFDVIHWLVRQRRMAGLI